MCKKIDPALAFFAVTTLCVVAISVLLLGLTTATSAQPEDFVACSAGTEMRLLQTAVPVTAEPTSAPPPDATATAVPPTPRPAPEEDRVGFPTNYAEEFQFLFVFDRADNRTVRVICGNDAAASVQPGEPFPYGSILTMDVYRAKLDDNGQPLLDENGNYIRESFVGVFVQRKEPGFGEAYEEDRSGEWEYVAYRADGSFFTPPRNTNACSSCHLNQGGESIDFVFRMDLHHEPDTAYDPPELAENEVSIFDYRFVPETLTVKKGTTVTWFNHDEAEHTVTSADETFDSGVLSSVTVGPIESFSVTFDEVGTFEYTSSVNRNMDGIIEVVE